MHKHFHAFFAPSLFSSLLFSLTAQCDLIRKDAAKRVIADFTSKYPDLFSETFMISAMQGVGVDDLRDYLLYKAQPRPWTFHPRVNSDLSALQKVEEIIREHCFKNLDLEVPYAIEQVNTGWTPLINGDLRIDFDLLVDKEAQVVSDNIHNFNTLTVVFFLSLFLCPPPSLPTYHTENCEWTQRQSTK